MFMAYFSLSGCDDAGSDANSSDASDHLVVYCAHDSIYSEEILNRFTKETGIDIDIRFDTEATKSLGLVQSIIAEAEHPRCDVFWNNEILGTLDLAERGLLHAYQSPNADRIPAKFKSTDSTWTGFGGRLRLYIINTNKMEASPESVEEALTGDLSQMAVAKPLYGTTLTQYALMWSEMGGDAVKEWYQQRTKQGWKIVQGNAVVKNLVASGVCEFGWTDTDDYFLAVDDKQPVAMLPIRTEGGQTICIPNTVAIVKGTEQESASQQLVDFLLSPEIELALANSRSRQVPLGTVDETKLPEQVKQLQEWAAEGVPLEGLLKARNECLDWLKEEFLQ
ncbi:putative binding protein component of ABC iron transporter precursor [Polystyrenella longa]|uniref:Putative binding protein component of ABC iron transporter n=2 Tax=Polystyrenella longa TaxID=2528007 RepID=A0A518CHT9_9PLAN|nr:putative binding protein component of ABC iron transporter precursor [Polystyrenella longa]